MHVVDSGSNIVEKEGFAFVETPNGMLKLLQSCPYNVHQIIADHKKDQARQRNASAPMVKKKKKNFN